MDNIGTLLLAVLVDVIHIKLLCQQGIPLNGNHGIFLAVYILCIDIYLRTIEGCLTLCLIEGNIQLLQNITDVSLSFLPDLRLPNILILVVRVPLGKSVGNIIIDTQRFQTILCQCQTVLKLLYHLVGSYNQMSLGNGKLTYSGQSVHLSGILVSEQCGGFTVTAGQVTIGLLACLVYIILERTGHGTQCKYLFVLLLIPEYKHALLVMVPVSGNLVQITLRHQRGLGTHITPLVILQILNPSLEGLDNLCSLGHQQGKALTDNINSGKQFHLTSQLIVVAVLDILPVSKVLFQLFLLIKSSTVNSL